MLTSSDYGANEVEEKNIEYGPTVYDQPDNLLIYPGTESAYLDCKVMSNPISEFTWLKDGDVTTSETDDRYDGFKKTYIVALSIVENKII